MSRFASNAPSARSVENGQRSCAKTHKETAPVKASPTENGVVPVGFIPLIDPTGFGGLIQVPVNKTFDTKGRTEYLKGILRKEVSLCCLFQKGRCHAGEKCHQIHVDNNFVRAVRQQNANIVSCCRGCKDTASLSPSAVAFFASNDVNSVKIVGPDGRFNTIPADKLAWTTGLSQHVESEGDLSFLPVKKMCRLHLRGSCKYGKDCKNIHLCSKLTEAILSPTGSPVPEQMSRRSSVATTPCVDVGIMNRSEGSNSRRSSVASDAPKDYFRESRFATPSATKAPQAIDVFEESSPKTERRLSFSQVDLNNVSFLENTVGMSGLCFDPMLLLQEEEPKHHPKTLSADWFEDCGASSTASQGTSTPQRCEW